MVVVAVTIVVVPPLNVTVCSAPVEKKHEQALLIPSLSGGHFRCFPWRSIRRSKPVGAAVGAGICLLKMRPLAASVEIGKAKLADCAAQSVFVATGAVNTVFVYRNIVRMLEMRCQP